MVGWLGNTVIVEDPEISIGFFPLNFGIDFLIVVP